MILGDSVDCIPSIQLMEAEVALYWKTVCRHLETEAQVSFYVSFFKNLLDLYPFIDALSLFCGKKEGFFFFLEGGGAAAGNQMGWTWIEFNPGSSWENKTSVTTQIVGNT
jgi:hypothetical protein